MQRSGKDKYSENRKLKFYLDSLSDEERRIASIKIRTECMIPYYKYTNWIVMRSRLEPLYCKAIENALGVKIF